MKEVSKCSLTSEQSVFKLQLLMAFQTSAGSFGIRRLGFKCGWWHPRQANDAVASEPSIFSENHDYKSFFRVTMNMYVPIFRGLDVRGGRNIRCALAVAALYHKLAKENVYYEKCLTVCVEQANITDFPHFS